MKVRVNFYQGHCFFFTFRQLDEEALSRVIRMGLQPTLVF